MSVELFLNQAVILLAAAIAVLLVSHWLRVPAVVGLLLTGILVGPSGLGLIGETEQVRVFAEIGVIFLLFAVGLEFSLARVREVKRSFFLGGGLQSGFTIVAGTLAGLLLAGVLPRAIFFGFVVALSSTAIVLKLYNDRRETESPHGGIAISIVLFQDFLIVPMILLTPVLAGQAQASPAAVALRLAISAALVGLVFVTARRVMPPVLGQVARTRVRELFVLGGVGACLGMAVLTHQFGLSFALGAFVAGLVISESEYSHQVIADVAPLRDLFSSVFFISIGMLLEVPFALANLPAVLGLAAGIVVLKALATTGAVLALRYPPRTALLVGLGLAQIGEFSFVLLELGRANGLVDRAAYQHLIGASVVTMLLTPLLIGVAPGLAARWTAPLPAGSGAERRGRLRNHVIVVGFGLAGRTLAHVLESARLPFVVVELNGEAVRRARAEGSPIIFGDATRREVLEAAAIADAGAIVYVVSDIDAVRRSVRLARSLNPGIHVVVRTRQFAQIEDLVTEGANEVIAEEFETSIEILTRVLRHFHVPRNLILAETRLLRGESYRMLRSPAGDSELTATLLNVLQAGTTDLFLVDAGSAVAGRTIRDLDLRRRAGASVIAVVRGESPQTNPPPEFEIRAGDCLVLVGSHEQIETAFTLLQSREADAPP